MTRTAKQMWGAAVATSPGYLIDKFLDWIEELSLSMEPAHVKELACIDVRTYARLDR